MSVTTSAVNDPGDEQSTPVLKYFEDMMLKSGTSGWASVPEEFRFSEVSGRKYGEMAEKMVHDKLKKATEDIPGLKIVHFHNIRMTGRTEATNTVNAIREVDNAVFIQYQGRYYFKIMETKSNQWIDKGSKQHRKKAVGQLTNIKSILASELNIDMDAIQTHVMWPNMHHEEKCKCGNLHPTFTKLRDNPEPPDFHVFKNKFEGDEFTSWLISQVTDVSMAIEKDVSEKLMAHISLLSIGVLHDKEMDSFCILAPEQRALVSINENTLRRPLGVRGLAGSGKTFVVCARIENHFKSGDLTENSKAAYVFFEPNVKHLVENKLATSGVALTNVKFIDYVVNQYNIQNIFKDDSVLENLIIDHNISFLFFDSAEDMGFKNLEKAVQKILSYPSITSSFELQAMRKGDFWVLFDNYQGIEDNHIMERRYGNELYWVGHQLDEKMLQEGVKQGRICFLSNSFRMSKNIVNHIKDTNVIPFKDFHVFPTIEGIQVNKPPAVDILDNYMETLSKEIIAKRVFELTHGRGIHPGYCSILYDEESIDILFPTSEGGLPTFLQMLNEELKSKFVPTAAKYAPQVTTSMQESVHYKHQELAASPHHNQIEFIAMSSSDDIRATVQYQHDNHPQNLLECECQTYIGTVRQMKGNETRIVLYLQAVQGKGELKRNENTETTEDNDPDNDSLKSNPRITEIPQENSCYQTFLKRIHMKKKYFLIISMVTLILAYIIGSITWWALSLSNITSTSPNTSSNNNTSITSTSTRNTTITTLNATITTCNTNITTRNTTITTEVNNTTSKKGLVQFIAQIVTLFVVFILLILYAVKIRVKKEWVLKTLPYYLAISRSSCEVYIIDIIRHMSVQTETTPGKPVGINEMVWRKHQNDGWQTKVLAMWNPVFRNVERHKLEIQTKVWKDKWIRRVFNKLPTPERALLREALNHVDSQIDGINVDHLCAWASQLDEESAFDFEVKQGIDRDTFTQLIQEYPKQDDQYMNKEEFVGMMKQYFDMTDYKRMTNLKKMVYVLAYAEGIRLWPPPPFTVIFFLIQLCMFIYHIVYLRLNFPDYEGNVALCSVFLLNPHRRWELWRFFTYSWVHNGYFHIVINLIVLILVGLSLELTHKWWRVTIVYLSGILCASMSVSIFDSKIALSGFSGGAYALVGAHLATLILNWREDNVIVVRQVRNYERTRAVKAKTIRIFRLLFVFSLIVVDTVVTIHSKLQDNRNNISNMAPFTGCLAGIIIRFQIMKNRRPERWERILKWVFFIMTLILIIIGIVLINEKFQYYRFVAIPPEDIPVDYKEWNVSEKLCQDIMYKNIRDNCSDLHWTTFRYYCPLD